MPSGQDIQTYLGGAWRLMTGREDGLDRLDLSVDGFWNSFFAMVVAFPALTVGWVTLANRIGGTEVAGRFAVVLRLAVIDVAAWVLPIALLAVAVRHVGIAHRFVPYVVASNWGSALLIWLMLPASVLELLFPGATDATDALGLVVFIAALVLSWRLTRAAIGMGAAVATWVFCGMFVASLIVILTLQPLFGVTYS